MAGYAAHLAVTYFLWIMFGWTGIHQFYLRRNWQGTLWLTSFGGCFGLGWIRDSWRIPTYVLDSIDNPEFLSQMDIKMTYSPSGPTFLSNLHRIVAQVLFAMFYRGLIYCAIPWDSYLMDYAGLIIPLGTAFGIYMVANVGWQKSSLSNALAGAYLGEVFCRVTVNEPSSLMVAVSAVFISPAYSAVFISPTSPTPTKESRTISSGKIAGWIADFLAQVSHTWQWRKEWLSKDEVTTENDVNNEQPEDVPTKYEGSQSRRRNLSGQKNSTENDMKNEKPENVSTKCEGSVVREPKPLKQKKQMKVGAENEFKYSLKTKRRSLSRGKCFGLVFFIFVVFLALCLSYIYFNATVETEDGETIKVRDAMDNFFNSPAWKQSKSAFWVLLTDLYNSWRSEGYQKAWEKFIDLADVDGENRAYDVLGLKRGVEFMEVRQRYKELAKEWHPDHHQGNSKQEAKEKFVEYNRAYKVLEEIHKRRKNLQ